MEIDKPAVGKRLQKIMQQAQVTQKDLAELLGISQPAVSQYLQGRIPPGDVLLKIARLGNTTIEWLLTGEKNGRGAFNQIKEPPPAYGTKAVLFDLWEKLPSNIQSDLLTLIRHILTHASRKT